MASAALHEEQRTLGCALDRPPHSAWSAHPTQPLSKGQSLSWHSCPLSQEPSWTQLNGYAQASSWALRLLSQNLAPSRTICRTEKIVQWRWEDLHSEAWGRLPRKGNIFDSESRVSLDWATLCGTGVHFTTVVDLRSQIWLQSVCVAVWGKSSETVHLRVRIGALCDWALRGAQQKQPS